MRLMKNAHLTSVNLNVILDPSIVVSGELVASELHCLT